MKCGVLSGADAVRLARCRFLHFAECELPSCLLDHHPWTFRLFGWVQHLIGKTVDFSVVFRFYLCAAGDHFDIGRGGWRRGRSSCPRLHRRPLGLASSLLGPVEVWLACRLACADDLHGFRRADGLEGPPAVAGGSCFLAAHSNGTENLPSLSD